MFLVVPNYVRDAINAKLDAAIEAAPNAAKDRDVLYGQLLEYFNDNGVVPEFSLVRKDGQS